VNDDAPAAVPLLPIPTDLQLTIPRNFTDMVLYDSGPSDNRIIIFGSDERLDGLGMANVWLAGDSFQDVTSI
jgi:hypothetical protein